MAKDRSHDPKRTVGSFDKMGAALGWSRDSSSWADTVKVDNGQEWPTNAVNTSQPHSNEGINKHHDGDFKKDRNEVYNLGGGHVYTPKDSDTNTYKLN